MLGYAHELGDLAFTAGQPVGGSQDDLSGFHSIRINDQWRVTFRWTASGPADADIRDYH